MRGLQLDRLQERFTLPSYLIIDEYSMVGLRMLGRIDRRLRQATGHLQEPFGGVNILLVGDILQLPPIKDAALYKAFSAKDSAEVQAGWTTFSLFNIVVELNENQRQSDPAQARFRDLLMQLRHGRHDKTICYDFLSIRMIGLVNPDIEAEFRDAVSLHHSNARVDSTNTEELNKLTVASHTRPAQRICRIDAVCVLIVFVSILFSSY